MPMRAILVLLSIFFGFFPAIASAQELAPEVRARLFAPTADVPLASKIVSIPMRGTDRAGNGKCPYFRVYVNGKGPFTFLFDTGAAYTLVSSRVIDAAKPDVIVDRTRRDVVHLRELKLDGATLRDVWAIHDDDFGVDGIIGFPAFGTTNLMFDFGRRELRVSDRPMPMPRGLALPYKAEFNVPTVPVRIGGRSIQILIDTGDDSYGLGLKRDELGDAKLAYPPRPAGTVMNGANRQSTAITELIEPVGFGRWRAERAAVAVNDDLPVGDFGYYMLKQFIFQIDPKRRTITFAPLFEGDQFRLAIPSARSR